MKVTFIGSSTCIPDIGREVSSLLIDGKHLVDTGWGGVLKMREYGFDPLKIESLILTHLHQDHYLGLPHLLFYLSLKRNQRSDTTPLRIVGPVKHLKTVVNAALLFLQISRFSELKVNFELISIAPGEDYEIGELHLETCAAAHTSGANTPEQALVYRFKVYHISDKLDYLSASFSEPLSYAVHAVDKAGISQNDSVGIIGGGSQGQMFVQLARLKGAKEIIMITRSEKN